MADPEPPLGSSLFAGAAGLGRLIVLGGVAGFGLVSIWANFGDTLGDAWNNVVTAIGTPATTRDSDRSIVGRASVIDGDTIEIRGTRIRLNGIDAPESRQSCRDGHGVSYACGRQAAFALSDKIGSRNVSCEVLDHDPYGRSVAACSSAGADVNAWMVASGWALAYREYSTAYVSAEAQAKAARVGIWRGKFTPPWEWRRSNDEDERPLVAPASDAASGRKDCAIKGNINASGERIFHSPGQQHYSRTSINLAAGERWFCSAAEARAAGWRAARR